MKSILYLIPVTLGDTTHSHVLPAFYFSKAPATGVNADFFDFYLLFQYKHSNFVPIF